MARLYKIQISKIENEVERKITINALDIDKYITNGWTAETEPYIDNPVMIQPANKVLANTDASSAQDGVETGGAVVNTTEADKATEAVQDAAIATTNDDLLID